MNVDECVQSNGEVDLHIDIAPNKDEPSMPTLPRRHVVRQRVAKYSIRHLLHHM